MLGHFTATEDIDADTVLAEAAEALTDSGLRVAGAVQVAQTEAGRPRMTLRLLGGGPSITISQDLGPEATGCRLDPDGLERAVALVDRALDARPDLLVINRFGKQEAAGRGFRPLIGRALSDGIPVLLVVSHRHGAAFDAFADGLGEALPPRMDALVDWARRNALREPAA
ncbi:DUF2478 domain-containing protein [Anianabacter salinae]|uniref:DUF2478 domain-containing protein n=1 Tax=Anianabacter salinae TaxID=2851023 RepID=UPI00225DD57F|nr:DUF2478 domain-containing protein [Anianabacter salinae]MBV0912376.1 DUF2478 domain-containing protein [Anianabacter salinae]